MKAEPSRLNLRKLAANLRVVNCCINRLNTTVEQAIEVCVDSTCVSVDSLKQLYGSAHYFFIGARRHNYNWMISASTTDQTANHSIFLTGNF